MLIRFRMWIQDDFYPISYLWHHNSSVICLVCDVGAPYTKVEFFCNIFAPLALLEAAIWLALGCEEQRKNIRNRFPKGGVMYK